MHIVQRTTEGIQVVRYLPLGQFCRQVRVQQPQFLLLKETVHILVTRQSIPLHAVYHGRKHHPEALYIMMHCRSRLDGARPYLIYIGRNTYYIPTCRETCTLKTPQAVLMNDTWSKEQIMFEQEGPLYHLVPGHYVNLLPHICLDNSITAHEPARRQFERWEELIRAHHLIISHHHIRQAIGSGGGQGGQCSLGQFVITIQEIKVIARSCPDA